MADLFRARQTKKASDFYELARLVAKGENFDPAQVASALEEFGKTPEDLEQLVNGLQQLAAYARQFATIPGNKARLEQVAATFKAAEDDFRPIHAAFMEKRKQLLAEAEYVQGQINQAEPMRPEVDRNLPRPPDCRTRRATPGSQRHRAQHQACRTDGERTRERYHVCGRGSGGAARCFPPKVRESKILAAASCRETAAGLKGKLPALKAREAEILEAMLTP